jgi:hypothetical protein
VLKWPGRRAVESALRRWAAEQRRVQPELLRLGFFGSYARGDWGVGSDLDLIAIVTSSPAPFEWRSRGWDLDGLPVPTQILVYTQAEWEAMRQRGGRFVETIERETVWV